jgi:hypothetical protein
MTCSWYLVVTETVAKLTIKPCTQALSDDEKQAKLDKLIEDILGALRYSKGGGEVFIFFAI